MVCHLRFELCVRETTLCPVNLLLRNARIASESTPDLPSADVLIQDGIIQKIAQDIAAPEGSRVIDCAGGILCPGFFDAHVHFREPGQEQKENIASGSEAAINGGITGIVMMPNTSPALDSGASVSAILESGKRNSRIPIFTSGCVTKGREGKELAGIDGMRGAGVKMLTDDGDTTINSSILYRAMQYASEFDMFFASHCEVPELAGPRALNDGPTSYKLGIAGSPACAEEIIIDRDIRLAHATGAHHHLLFTDEHIGDFDTHYKMNPPLRTKADNEALLEGLLDGTFDLIATDHAPHTPFEKSQDFVSAPNGITGLDTAVVSLYHHFIKKGKFGWDTLVRKYSAEPRRLMSLEVPTIEEGQHANLTLFNTEATSTFTKDFMKSKAQNTPFLDKTLSGRVDLVVLGDAILLER
jgi:dihydroorotase